MTARSFEASTDLSAQFQGSIRGQVRPTCGPWPIHHTTIVHVGNAAGAGSDPPIVYRSEAAPDGERVRLNETLIPTQVAPASNAGAVYDWLDPIISK